jgi:hypothetical protein
MEDSDFMTTPVLCTASAGTWSRTPHADPWPAARDASRWIPRCRAVYHPPCAQWSYTLRHQATPNPTTAWLGVLACYFRFTGGVLEQPARSALFRFARLPEPGRSSRSLRTIYVEQAWWGFPTRKATWLCFSKRSTPLPEIPFKLHLPGCDQRTWLNLSHQQRSSTTPAFAQWLLTAVTP